jgi:hypothetical protein
VTHLHDGGHDTEENNIVKNQVTVLKRVVYNYKRYEGVYEVLFFSSTHSKLRH